MHTAMIQPVWNFEEEPYTEPADETAINLRAYLDRMPDEKMREYSPTWDDGRVVAWDGNFREDGALMLVCCERDVEVKHYRQVLEECIRYRDRVRGRLKEGTRAPIQSTEQMIREDRDR